MALADSADSQGIESGKLRELQQIRFSIEIDRNRSKYSNLKSGQVPWMYSLSTLATVSCCPKIEQSSKTLLGKVPRIILTEDFTSWY